MKPITGSSWWSETDRSLLNDHLDESVLAIRLGLAVNALRANHRWTTQVYRNSSAAGQADFMMSFVTAAAYTREALNILSGTGGVPPNGPVVRAMAHRAGVSAQLLDAIGRLNGGAHPATIFLTRIRNQLGFHWDPILIRESVGGFDDPVIWAEGRSLATVDCVYRLAADTLLNAIIPGFVTLPEAEGKRQFMAMVDHVSDAMDTVAAYFELAIAGFLMQQGAHLKRRWFHSPRELFRKTVSLPSRNLYHRMQRAWWRWRFQITRP